MNIASYIDHTQLKVDATEADIEKACKEAIQYHFKGLCTYTRFLPIVLKLLKGKQIIPVAVVDFPNGLASPQIKADEAKKAYEMGAQEIDMVINTDALKKKDYGLVFKGIDFVVKAAPKASIKVIIETCLLNEDEKIIASALSKAAGATFVKTSTGFSTGGATVEDLKLIRRVIGNDMQIKASGGIRSWEKMKQMIDAGADRIGSSSSVAIIEEYQKNS
jgi:deoxyribose-phosphate aldolase